MLYYVQYLYINCISVSFNGYFARAKKLYTKNSEYDFKTFI